MERPDSGSNGAARRAHALHWYSRWTRPALWLAALLALPASADASKVKGVVVGFRELQNPVWAESKDPKRHSFSFREPVPTVRAEFRKLFPHIPKELCIAAIGSAKQNPKPPILIKIGGGRTTPVTIVVPPGTQLTFKNTDPFKHRLYIVDLKTFPPSETGKGAERSWTVPGPGVYEIRDQAAPSLRMWVVAEPNVVESVYPSMKGEFLLTVPEPGDYTIQAFFAGKKVGPALAVKVDGGDLDVSKTPIVVAKPPGKEAKE
jgi:plastocyanin